jgi:hypothetical protein
MRNESIGIWSSMFDMKLTCDIIRSDSVAVLPMNHQSIVLYIVIHIAFGCVSSCRSIISGCAIDCNTIRFATRTPILNLEFSFAGRVISMRKNKLKCGLAGTEP